MRTRQPVPLASTRSLGFQKTGVHVSQVQDGQLVKSRHRVRAYGEVFTPRHMIERMLDLVREELETGPDFVDKTFLEPAAGHGNFLVAILHRKLRAVEKNYSPEEWPEASLFALASIYGIELLEDNHRAAKETMLTESRPPGHLPDSGTAFPSPMHRACQLGQRAPTRASVTVRDCVDIGDACALTSSACWHSLSPFSELSPFRVVSTGGPSLSARAPER